MAKKANIFCYRCRFERFSDFSLGNNISSWHTTGDQENLSE